MKPKFLLGLAPVLSGIFFSAYSINAQPSSKMTGWQSGQIVDGLQMITFLDETNGLLRCRIRNTTTNTLTINMSCEDCWLQIWQTTNWANVAAWKIPTCGASGSIRPKKIEAAQTIVSVSPYYPTAPFSDYLEAAHGNTNEALVLKQFNYWLADQEAKCQGDTFAFNLIESEWPPSKLSSVKIRVQQKLWLKSGLRYSYSDLTLYSTEFSLNDFLIQSFKNKNRQIKLP